MYGADRGPSNRYTNIAGSYPVKLPAQIVLLALLGAACAPAQTGVNVLVVINDKSSLSRNIGEYYALRRAIPAKNLCRIRTDDAEEIPRLVYNHEIAGPVADCLRRNGLADQVLYLVTTAGVPLKIEGSTGPGGDQAAVDSELALLYMDMHEGRPHTLTGMVPNPLFGKRDAKFTHPEFPIYLVTRLAAY